MGRVQWARRKCLFRSLRHTMDVPRNAAAGTGILFILSPADDGPRSAAPPRCYGPHGNGDRQWPFGDRVLVWLAPHWREDIEKYLDSSADNMAQRFAQHQLARGSAL